LESKSTNSTLVQLFRGVAVAEGVSYLAFGASMPLKYGWGILWPNQWVGMAHGALFLAFCGLLAAVWYAERWPLARVLAFGLASLLPYGTIWLERRVFRAKK
jgi:integral membrane protein